MRRVSTSGRFQNVWRFNISKVFGAKGTTHRQYGVWMVL